MKIERFLVPESTIEDFAEKHGLTMEIHERSDSDPDSRFYANFANVELKFGPVLAGTHGNGPNEEAAIKNYAKEISLKSIIVNEASVARRVIQCPRFI